MSQGIILALSSIQRSGRLVSLALLLSILFVTGCDNKSSSIDNHLSKGKAYLDSGNHEKARIEFKNVLQIDPNNLQACLLLGRTEEADKNWQKAYVYYTKALNIDGNNIEAHSRAGRLNFLAGNVDTASEHMNAILSQDKENYDGLILKATIYAKNKDYDAAADVTRNLLARYPSNREVISLLSNIYISQKKLAKAVDTLKKGLASNADNTQLLVLLAQVYVAMGAMNEAEATLTRLISIEPDVLVNYINLSSFYSRQGQVDKSIATLRKAIAIKPDDESRYLLLAELYANNNSTNESINVLKEAIENIPNSNSLRFTLARLYLKFNDVSNAYAEYKNLIRVNDTSDTGLQARTELADAYFQHQHLDEATNLVDEVFSHNPKYQNALILQGKISLAKSDYDAAILTFRTLYKDQPDSTEITNLLIKSHILNNDTEIAIEILNKLVLSHPDDIQTRIELVKQLIKARQFDAGLGHINYILEKSKPELTTLQLKAELLISKNDNQGALETLLQIRKMYPNFLEVHKQIGAVYQELNMPGLALKEYEDGLNESGTLLPYMALITSLHIHQGEISTALKRLGAAINRTPDEPVLHELQGEAYIADKNYTRAIKAFNTAISIKPDWNLPYVSLAKAFIEQKQPENAITACMRGLNAIPSDERLSTDLADIYSKLNRHDDAIAVYDHVLAINPGNDLAANNLASLLIETKGDEQSLARATTLAGRFASSRNPVYLDTLGWSYYQTGNYVEAVNYLKKASKLAPEVPHFNYHLGMAYYKLGDPVAKIHLSKALESRLRFPGRDTAEKTLKAFH